MRRRPETRDSRGPPDHEGIVEIAYGIVPAYRRQGYTFEAVQALVQWAFGHPAVTRITAQMQRRQCGVYAHLGETRHVPLWGQKGHTILWQLPRREQPDNC